MLVPAPVEGQQPPTVECGNYRGAALIMAADLLDTLMSGVTVQLCGDAHLSNFGLFGTPERQMIFDLNDSAAVKSGRLPAQTGG